LSHCRTRGSVWRSDGASPQPDIELRRRPQAARLAIQNVSDVASSGKEPIPVDLIEHDISLGYDRGCRCHRSHHRGDRLRCCNGKLSLLFAQAILPIPRRTLAESAAYPYPGLLEWQVDRHRNLWLRLPTAFQPRSSGHASIHQWAGSGNAGTLDLPGNLLGRSAPPGGNNLFHAMVHSEIWATKVALPERGNKTAFL